MQQQDEARGRGLMTPADWLKALQIGERKFHALRAAGVIPEPLQLGPRCSRWPASDLALVLQRLPRAEKRVEPETLAKGRRARIDAMKRREPGAAA